jgi:hypothetical protein
MTVLTAGITALALLAATPSPSPAAPSPCSGPVRYYVVPRSIHGEPVFLFDVAQATLGSGSRYSQILGLNRGRRQADGGRLEDAASALHAGWVLQLPADARGAGVRCGSSLPGAAASRPGATPRPAAAAAQGLAAPRLALPPVPPAAAIVAIGSAVGGAALLTVLAVVAVRARRPVFRGLRRLRARLRAPAWWRRRAALRRRAAHAHMVERDLGALPAAAAALAVLPTAGPRPYAVLVDPRSVTLHMAPAGPEPPPPWQTDDGGGTWRAPRHALGEAAVSAALPLLVTVGMRGDARVLVDLGRASGAVSVEGDAGAASDIVAAITGELAVAPWSTTLRTELVGGDVGGTLERAETARRRDPDGESDVARVLTGRRPDAAPHELLIVATPVPEAEAGRLAALARQPDAPLTVVAAGPVPGARWRWTVGDDGGLDLGPLGITVETHVGELTAAARPAGPRSGGRAESGRRVVVGPPQPPGPAGRPFASSSPPAATPAAPGSPQPLPGHR